MPKDTFYNLHEEKKNRILRVLKSEFETKPFHEVNVKNIVEELDIARGSFYQYFEDLQDSYYTILEKETVDIHDLFLQIFRTSGQDLFLSLEKYGEKIAIIIFEQNNYMIYKNRFLYWTQDLELGWKNYQKASPLQENGYKNDLLNKMESMDSEIIHFIKAIVHSLIKRIFQENWSKEEFLLHYNKHLNWIKKGVS